MGNLKKEMEALKKENCAHVQLVGQILEKAGDDTEVQLVGQILEKAGDDTEVVTSSEAANNNEDDPLPVDAEESHDDGQVSPNNDQESKIKELKQMIRKKDIDIRSWKTQFSALEGTLADANLQITSLKEQVLSSKAEARREKEINDILLLRIERLKASTHEVQQTPPRQDSQDLNISSPHSVLQGTMNYSTPIGELSTSRRTFRGEGEYVCLDSYYNNESGADGSFSHNPSDSIMDSRSTDPLQHISPNLTQPGHTNQQIGIVDNTHYPYQRPRNNTNNAGCGDVCVNAFKAGKNVCQATCSLKHDLDFSKIKRGVCFFEFARKGSCKRSAAECWFTHEIPEVLRTDYEMKYHVSRSLDKIQDMRQRSQRNKLPVTIRLYNQQAEHNFLPQMQRPLLQSSLPGPPSWSPQSMVPTNY